VSWAPFTWRTPANTNEPTLDHAIRMSARRAGVSTRCVSDLAPVIERVVAAMIQLEIASVSEVLHSVRFQLMADHMPREDLESLRDPHTWFKDLLYRVEYDVKRRAAGLRPRGLSLVHSRDGVS
jgi:hypothetical protein